MTARTQACLRGLEFIHRHSLEGDNFEDWSGDYMWCFRCVAATSRDLVLRERAAEFGADCARRWAAEQKELPRLADADEVNYYASLLHMSGLLGIEHPRLRAHVAQNVDRYSARDYLGFDPQTEPPHDLPGRSRYDVFCDALVTSYTGDGFGVPLGASYADVLRRLPEMRPYQGPFRDVVLAITHLVYTLNDYNRYRLSPKWLPEEFEFLLTNMKEPLAADDPELLGEFVDCLRSFGVTESDASLTRSVDYLLSTQNPDGSWGDVNEPDPHKRYHTVWTAVDALRDYAWENW